MKKVILIIALLFITTPAFAGNYHFTWDEENTALQIPMTALFILDLGQTIWNNNHGWKETNPAIGENVSKEKIYGYFIGTYALTTLAVWALPPKWSHALQGGAISVELYATGNNISLGVGISF